MSALGRRRLIASAIVAPIVLSLLFVFFVNVCVVQSTRERILTAPQADRPYDAIVVLGAGLRQDGSPSDMLRDRLDAAITLFHGGVSSRILLTGDRSGEDYDEVGAMLSYCLENEIPSDAILCDGDGYSTYESMENAYLRFGLTRVIVVTQKYHLYRAVYVANGLGMEADGFSSDPRTYRGGLYRNARECMARVKDFLLVTF